MTLQKNPVNRTPSFDRSVLSIRLNTEPVACLAHIGAWQTCIRVHAWNLSFVENNPLKERYQALSDRITDAMGFMEVLGITSENTSTLHETMLFTSHEALLLNYEQAMTRRDSSRISGMTAQHIWFGSGAHCQLDHAHIEFFKGIHNPISENWSGHAGR